MTHFATCFLGPVVAVLLLISIDGRLEFVAGKALHGIGCGAGLLGLTPVDSEGLTFLK